MDKQQEKQPSAKQMPEQQQQYNTNQNAWFVGSSARAVEIIPGRIIDGKQSLELRVTE